MEQDTKPKDNPKHLQGNLSLTKEASIYNGEKIVSSVSGPGRTCIAMCKRMK